VLGECVYGGLERVEDLVVEEVQVAVLEGEHGERAFVAAGDSHDRAA
jgi:hypothetical protein